MYKYINGEHPCVFFTRVELPKLEMIEKEALLYLTEDENKFESFKKGEIRVNNNIAYILFNGAAPIALNLDDGKIFIGNGSNQSSTSTLDTSIVPENTNLYYTDARFDTRLASKDTDNLTEGSNLYYTQARFDSAFGNKTTNDLTENTNLYYTTSRADSDAKHALTGGTSIVYSSDTGTISTVQAIDSTDNVSFNRITNKDGTTTNTPAAVVVTDTSPNVLDNFAHNKHNKQKNNGNFNNQFFIQPLVQWNPNPSTILYLGGNQNTIEDIEGAHFQLLQFNQTQFFFKFQYLIGL